MNNLTRYFPAYAILSVVAVLIVPVATVEPLWLSSVAAVAALAAVLENAGRREWPRLNYGLSWLLAALVIWGAASAIWSIAPERSTSQAIRLCLFAIGATLLLSTALNLNARGRSTLEISVTVGMVLGLVFILFELATGGLVHGALNGFEKNPVKNLFELNRASSVVSITIWVAILPVWRRFGWAGAFVLVLVSGVTISQLQPGSPFLAIVVGATVFVLAWLLPRIAMGVLLVAIATSLVMIPFMGELTPIVADLFGVLGISEFSLLHRMAIWQFASEQLLDQPLIGWGLDASRSVGAGQIVIVADAPNAGTRSVDALPLHPHNALLQAWLELGAVGALLLGALFATIVFAIRRYVRGRLEYAAASAAFAAAFVNAELSFGIWQGWWLSCLALVAILTAALAAPVRADDAAEPA